MKKRILVVDDDIPTAEMIARICQDELDCETAVASDGAAALAIVESSKVDLVLTDLQMPRVTGLELYDRLQAHPATMNIPVLFLTAGFGAEVLAKRGLAAIKKPFSLDVLLEQVAAALNQ